MPKSEIHTAKTAYRRTMGNQVYLFSPGQEVNCPPF